MTTKLHQEVLPTTWPGAFTRLLLSHLGICGLALFVSMMTFGLLVFHLAGGKFSDIDVRPARATALTTPDRPP